MSASEASEEPKITMRELLTTLCSATSLRVRKKSAWLAYWGVAAYTYRKRLTSASISLYIYMQ